MVLMLTMLFSLCGCGGNETDSSDAQIPTLSVAYGMICTVACSMLL